MSMQPFKNTTNVRNRCNLLRPLLYEDGLVVAYAASGFYLFIVDARVDLTASLDWI